MAKQGKLIVAADSVKTDVPKEQVRVTNMMQCDWIVPPKMHGKVAVDSRSLIRPLGSIVFDKETIDAFKKTKVGQAFFDLKLLTESAVDAPNKASKHDLISAPLVEPPAQLKGEGKTMEICNKAVTLDINNQIINR